jgi:hypothetical protein
MILFAPFLWVPEIAGDAGTAWHSEQAIFAEYTGDCDAAFRCFTWAPTFTSLVAVAPAIDLKGLVVAVLWQASQLLIFLTSP